MKPEVTNQQAYQTHLVGVVLIEQLKRTLVPWVRFVPSMNAHIVRVQHEEPPPRAGLKAVVATTIRGYIRDLSPMLKEQRTGNFNECGE